MTTEHTHSFVLFNTPGVTTNKQKEIRRLGLKIKAGQGPAMQRRAINLYLRQGGAMQVQQGSSLFVFPKEYKCYIEDIGDWIKANGGHFIVFDGCGAMTEIANSLHDAIESELAELARLTEKMSKQKQSTKALLQIEEVQRVLLANVRFMTEQQADRSILLHFAIDQLKKKQPNEVDQ